jgi:hypothetical protein
MRVKVPLGAKWDGGRLGDRKLHAQISRWRPDLSKTYSFLLNQPMYQCQSKLDKDFSPVVTVPQEPMPPPPSRASSPRLAYGTAPEITPGANR